MTTIQVCGSVAPVDAVVNVPGSKSVANRALVCAALVPSGGRSRVTNVPGGDDCVAMLDALRTVGALDGEVVTGGLLPGSGNSFDAGIAGTTSRFLTAASALSPQGCTVDGGAPLRSRPMADLHGALAALGAVVEPLGSAGHLPVRVARGSFDGGRVSVRGDVSSQFISALMLVAPALGKGLVIDIDGPLVSRPYVEMTAAVMAAFGAEVALDETTVSISPVPYVATEYFVEPDFSSAAFPLMSLAFTEGRVRIPGLARAVLQGDAKVLDIARDMGIAVEVAGDDIVASRSGSNLRPVSVNLADASDLVPAVATACTVADGTSEITGVGFIRAKESDRLGDFAAEASHFGASVEVLPDGLRIEGGVVTPTRSALSTHHDHRLAMAFALVAAGGVSVEICDPGVVAKSWPGYFEDMTPLLGEPRRVN